MLNINQLRQFKNELACHPLSVMEDKLNVGKIIIAKKIENRSTGLAIFAIFNLAVACISMVYSITNSPALIPLIIGAVSILGTMILSLSPDRLINYYMKKCGLNKLCAEMEEYIANPENHRELLIEVNKMAPFASEFVSQFKLNLVEGNHRKCLNMFLNMPVLVVQKIQDLEQIALSEQKKKNVQKFEQNLGLSEIEVEHNGNRNFKDLI